MEGGISSFNSASNSTSDPTDLYNLLKTENGVVLVCFLSGLMSMSVADIKNPICPVICILIFAVLAGMIISALCPTEIRPYVAMALLVVSGFGLLVRLFKGEDKQAVTTPNFVFSYTNSCEGRVSSDLTKLMKMGGPSVTLNNDASVEKIMNVIESNTKGVVDPAVKKARNKIISKLRTSKLTDYSGVLFHNDSIVYLVIKFDANSSKPVLVIRID
ncbi:hypothetical protein YASMINEVIRUS_1032 [Yasminevirus sp. GU-2018]|uniref:Uncharacterized protein n=1 Tax=Yasminevirus sp. GU-2018 TaxID=2420051 RepID=A0A5K0U8U2_9VIRU|nr:hypothetical protein YASMINEVIRUS_1032 [Yasminevirus sp. GU-2018]